MGAMMGFSAKVLADSVAPCGARLTTMEVTYPRFIHSELLTHRMLSRNSASSRAIPVEKMLQRIEEDPVIPIHWGAAQAGMQARAEIDLELQDVAKGRWLKARDSAVARARELLAMGLHKQVINRLVEPWMWITVIVSATEWDNFFALRCHPDAEPHFQKIAGMMRDARAASEPHQKPVAHLHAPLFGIHPDDVADAARLAVEMGVSIQQAITSVSVGRCARVSYLTHDGVRDMRKDIELHDRLMAQTPPHLSPFEHVALAHSKAEWFGNFRGWVQYRKAFETSKNENIEGEIAR